MLLLIPRVFEADLLREQRMALNEYFTLMHLSEAPQHRLRMSDLAGVGTLSLSGMTRIVSRLEELGLVQRERSANDGRGWHAVLTDDGLVRLRQAWPTHLGSVRRNLLGPLAPVDLTAFAEALRRVTDHNQCLPTSQSRSTVDMGGVSGS